MDRSALTKHWHWETDRDGLAWLTFDKQGESANTFSREALEQLKAALDEIRRDNPKGLVVRSAKEGFIAGADVEEFTRFKSPAEAMSFVRLGWDVFQALHERRRRAGARLPLPRGARRAENALRSARGDARHHAGLARRAVAAAARRT